MSYTHDQIINALKHVKYPGTGNDIVSLGMVDEVNIDNKQVELILKPLKANDPFMSSIKKASINALHSYVDADLNMEGKIIVKKEDPVRKVEPKKPDTESGKGIFKGVKNIIAIASGKGGVGKSTISANLSIALAKNGYKVGLIDADIYGPSIPKMFNVEGERPRVVKANGKDMIIPVEKYDVKMLSIGFFVNPDDALIWRGPMATSALKQLMLQGDWGELDYLLIDLPPGTSDIHLTLVQEVPVTGAIIVSTPQDVALADAVKGIGMFTDPKINVPILGMVENMSWFTPAEYPENKYYIFGKDGCKHLAEKLNVPLLGQVPIVQSIREGGDQGRPSALDGESIIGAAFAELGTKVLEQIVQRNQILDPTQKVEITNTDGCST
jgi:ATP-binding protein involved in chromosome partitioning